MPDQISSFEQALEADMHQLATEIKQHRERPEMQSAGEKELVKEAIRAFPVLEKHPAAPTPLTQQHMQQNASNPLPVYAQNAPAEVKLEIEYLLDLALREGLGKALSESKHSPYFVQDAFHDALAGKLYPVLQARGLVK